MDSHKPQSQLLVIFGASGDLAYRKLIPALFNLYQTEELPQPFAVLGASRTPFTDEAFREKMQKGIREFAHHGKEVDEDKMNTFLQQLHYLSMDPEVAEEYTKLKQRLSELTAQYRIAPNYIFYLSTPPVLYPVVPKHLAEQGLNNEDDGFKRVIIEKPFGTDLESAIALNHSLLKDYKEEQLYRIDHYMGKETVQNILVTRFGNGIYEPLWNRNYIHHVEITTSESIGVENRGGYYDHSGALRDMIQNHLLQLLAVVAMEPPVVIDSEAIRNEKMKVFQALRPYTEQTIKSDVIRGQYTAAHVKGEPMAGYREEKGVDTDSRTETYVAMKLFVDNWRWGDVPFYIRTGKRLPTRVSEVVIYFKPTPQRLFSQYKEGTGKCNQLILRIQPDEGILLKTVMKIPGRGFEVQNVNLDFHYSSLSETYVPEAYERLLLDCMLGDSTLYIRGDAHIEAWQFVQPILDYWAKNPDASLYGYPAGSWGPDVADSLIEGQDMAWRYPCKNLSDDGIYCEL